MTVLTPQRPLTTHLTTWNTTLLTALILVATATISVPLFTPIAFATAIELALLGLAGTFAIDGVYTVLTRDDSPGTLLYDFADTGANWTLILGTLAAFTISLRILASYIATVAPLTLGTRVLLFLGLTLFITTKVTDVLSQPTAEHQ